MATKSRGSGARRSARELALQMLFQFDLSGNDVDHILERFDDLERAREDIRRFAIRLFRGTVEHRDEIDDRIQRQAQHWKMSRMAVVDRNIIRMSVYELMYERETPHLVVIDEAIEIGKRFGTEKSSQFINGILDGILKRYNLETVPRKS
ncbi:MAG: transcription antitermination factor NusB [Thermoanaerobaculia bacterium]|nr:transcription antitermination factor NusB [Thermoanaerobaculia bacterium]